MMVPDDRPNVAGKVDVRDELEARFRVALHDRPLFVGELARFVQDFRRHDDLSDIVEQGADPEPEERSRIESRAVREHASKERNTLAVPLRIPVLAFNRITPLFRHLQEARFERAVSLLHLGDAMLRLELRVERVGLVEALEHVAMPILRPKNLRDLLRYIRSLQEISTLQ